MISISKNHRHYGQQLRPSDADTKWSATEVEIKFRQDEIDYYTKTQRNIIHVAEQNVSIPLDYGLATELFNGGESLALNVVISTVDTEKWIFGCSNGTEGFELWIDNDKLKLFDGTETHIGVTTLPVQKELMIYFEYTVDNKIIVKLNDKIEFGSDNIVPLASGKNLWMFSRADHSAGGFDVTKSISEAAIDILTYGPEMFSNILKTTGNLSGGNAVMIRDNNNDLIRNYKLRMIGYTDLLVSTFEYWNHRYDLLVHNSGDDTEYLKLSTNEDHTSDDYAVVQIPFSALKDLDNPDNTNPIEADMMSKFDTLEVGEQMEIYSYKLGKTTLNMKKNDDGSFSLLMRVKDQEAGLYLEHVPEASTIADVNDYTIEFRYIYRREYYYHTSHHKRFYKLGVDVVPMNITTIQFIDNITSFDYNDGDYSIIEFVFERPVFKINVEYANDIGRSYERDLRYFDVLVEKKNIDEMVIESDGIITYKVPTAPMLGNVIEWNITSRQAVLNVEEVTITPKLTTIDSEANRPDCKLTPIQYTCLDSESTIKDNL
jgi:hypothetical protein